MSSLILRNNKPFLNMIVTCNEKWILYNKWWWPAQWLDWEEALKHFSKLNFHQKNGHVHCLVVCCLSDPLQLSESQWNHYIWEVRWANQWDAPKTSMPADRTGQQKGVNSFPWQCPTTHRTINTSKVERIGLQSFASSTVFTWPFVNWLLLLQASRLLFAGKTLPQPAGCRKCFPRVHQTLKHTFLCCRNKQTYFSLAKMCWLQWFLFWLIKMCLSLVMIQNSWLKP